MIKLFAVFAIVLLFTNSIDDYKAIYPSARL